ncbi:Uncharacterised protein [Chlamydia trachomatis]|nr:Uncharacterised protein [Chlamydia trachomatis]
MSTPSSMMKGELDPSSSVSLRKPACCWIRCPTSTLPVKVTFFTCGWVVKASLKTSPLPGMMFNTPSGNPASLKISARTSALNGVCSAGFNTIEFPAAIAGPTLWATRLKGKLNGVIAVTTPIGVRTVKPKRFTPPTAASIGICSP